jgi:hypothetical protein
MNKKQWNLLRRTFVFGVMIIALLTTNMGGVSLAQAGSDPNSNLVVDNAAILFVSRQIPRGGSAYYSATGSLPGVQAFSRFQVAAPGKLLVREANGTFRTLIDGSKPTAASLNLIDVSSTDVSYDATKIVFAGLPAGSYSAGTVTSPGAWRIYVINVDGTGLRQLTFSDRNINLSQFGNNSGSFATYDDFDATWLPDGRIVFSSTRFPGFSMYGAARTTNLYVMNADGSNMHRITSEHNGAERPLVDPLTGKIVYSRWWRNFRVATNSMATLADPNGGYIMKDGLCAVNHSGNECQEVGGSYNLERNAWHLATINPDGTGLAQWAGVSNTTYSGQLINHAYGGTFTADGNLYANFYPMTNGTEASGFGGIRFYKRGINSYTPVIGITTRDEGVQKFANPNPPSYGVYVGNYATDPAILPDGRLVISLAKDVNQDYGLYTINSDGSGLTLLYDNPGTSELRTHVIRPRTVPPVVSDKITKVANPLPPSANGPYDVDGTFTFQNLNVYFNAPVDVDIINAIPVGSANTIRFFIDHLRSQQRGSFESLDWPILLQEVVINPNGSLAATSPANVPLFEQIRTKQPEYSVPMVGKTIEYGVRPGAAHVAGENFGRPGDVQRCVGCHAGHSMIQVPANAADAQWTNLAPGANVTASSTGSGSTNGLIDRRVKLNLSNNGNTPKYWASQSSSPTTQWVQLSFPVPVTVRTVRLYNPASSDSSVKVLDATVRLFSDAGGTVEVANKNSGALTDSGTNVNFSEVLTRVVKIQFNSVNGSAAALGEVEVIARGEAPNATSVPTSTATPVVTVSPTGTLVTGTLTNTPAASETATSTPTDGAAPTGTVTPTSIFTVTSVPPSSTAQASATVVPTNTTAFTPTVAASPIPTDVLPPSTKILAPASLRDLKGSSSGSPQSLGLLQQKKTEDDPAAYMIFDAPNRKAYIGYQSFYIPGDVNRASIASVSLEMNYKAAAPAYQTWSLLAYNWKTRRWTKLGNTSNMLNSTEWQYNTFPIANFQRYISSGNEIRIQLRSNNGRSDIKVDYDVIKIDAGVSSAVNSISIFTLTPTEVFTPTPTFTPTASPTSTPTQ